MAPVRWPLSLLLLAHAAPAARPPAIQQYVTHPGFQWKCESAEHFEFCLEASLESDVYLAAARNSAELARTRILQTFGAADYTPQVYVFFVESPERMQKLIGYHGEGRARPAQHAIFFVPTRIRPDLTHELTHEILTNLWGAAEAWIEEGFAALQAEPFAVHRTCLSMAVRQVLLPLPALVNATWNPAQYSPDITYVELGGFVEFLQARYGTERVKKIWQQGSASIPRVLGKPLTSVETEWRSALDQEVARRWPPRN